MSEKFHKFENFKNEFTDAAMSVFGSGYAWLVYDGKKLKITTTKIRIHRFAEDLYRYLILMFGNTHTT